MKPILYGAAYSVYVRAARLALIEKGVDHDRVEVDIFAADGPPPDYLARHPFGRIPALQHGAMSLYETAAIVRYVDEAFPGPALQPRDPAGRARMNQTVSVLDNYLYRPLVWGVYVARSEKGGACDEALVAAAAAKARHCLGVIERGLDRPFLAGDAITLADLYAVPMLAYGLMAEEGRAMLAECPQLSAWWRRMKARPSVAESRFAGEAA